MYIIACRAHFCHLLGLGQVGHSPRGTSGSAGTLDWGPMWLGSQSTCHPNTPLTPLDAPDTQNGPYTPRSSHCPWCPYSPSGPWIPRVPPSPQYTPDTLYTPDAPTPKNGLLHPLGAPNATWCPYTPSVPWVPRVPASPNTPLHPWHPKTAPTPTRSPQCP